MAPPGKKKDKKRRADTQEDLELWKHVTRSVTPLHEQHTRAAGSGAEPAQSPSKQSNTQAHSSKAKSDSRIRTTLKPRQSAKKQAATSSKAVELDRRQTRKLTTGRRAIDATIDLHGMRQHEAHAALRSFILMSFAASHRTVLVITGKGRRTYREMDPDTIVSERREHGVLRRVVPEWLDTDSDIAPLVLSYAKAHIRHGGDGAIYVNLRRSRQP